MITDPLDPRFVPPPPGGAELSSMQGRASPLAQQRIREREDAQAHLRHLRRLWDDLAQALHPYERPDPRAVSDWLYELVTTEHGTGPRWEMMQRADAERMRRALEFGDRLRSSPFHAAVYGVARLSGLSHEDAQAITEDPGYQLTFRLLRSLGIDDDDASQYATAVAVVTALIGFAIALRGRGRPSGQRPSTGGRTTAQPVVPRPNRAARRALQAQQRTAERRQQRARASAAREEQRRLRQARDVERRARISAETTRRALERARLRRELPHPHAQARTPNLRREFARDWGRRSPAAAEYRAEWERAQGFVGVYNPRTGEILVRPSPPNRHGPFSQPPAEWVRRGGGHGDLAAELSGMQVWTHPPNVPANQRLRAFTLVRDGDGFVIRWDSQAVNGIFNSPSGPGMEPPPRLPSGLRGEVIDAVRFHTGETIRDGG